MGARTMGPGGAIPAGCRAAGATGPPGVALLVGGDSISRAVVPAGQGDRNFHAIPPDRLHEVQSAWDELLRLDPFHAEAHAVVGTLLGMRGGRSPWRAIRWGPVIQRHQRVAPQLGRDNPRVLYLYGAALASIA